MPNPSGLPFVLLLPVGPTDPVRIRIIAVFAPLRPPLVLEVDPPPAGGGIPSPVLVRIPA